MGVQSCVADECRTSMGREESILYCVVGSSTPTVLPTAEKEATRDACLHDREPISLVIDDLELRFRSILVLSPPRSR